MPRVQNQPRSPSRDRPKKWHQYVGNILPLLLLGWLLWNRVPLWWQQWKIQGTEVPASTLLDANGAEVPFPPVVGKKQVLIFWASWCGPCKIELSRFQSALRAGDLPPGSVQTIAVWDEPANIQAFMAKNSYTFPVYYTRDAQLLRQLQVLATPTVVHLDENRRIRWATSGISPTGILRAQKFIAP